MTEKSPPIEESSFVVDIGDYRVSRGLTRRPFSGCHHRSMVYDERERRVWCKDCESDVEAFDAFLKLSNHFRSQTQKLETREKIVADAESHSIIWFFFICFFIGSAIGRFIYLLLAAWW